MGLIDKHYHQIKQVTERVTQNVNTTVHEHRAPTDESLKLLKEFDQTAKNNLLFSITVNDNTLNGTILAFRCGFNHLPEMKSNDIITKLDTELYYLFILNGKEFRGKEILPYTDPQMQKAMQPSYRKEFYFKYLANKISKVIADELIVNYLKSII